MRKHIKANIDWVGVIDWELRKFHGDDFSTNHGSSYNAYLIQEEKTVLIDTVWRPYAKGFVENLKQEMDLSKIDFIVANHGEVDHSGALPELMKEIPDTPIYCTQNAVNSLRGQYHQDWNFKIVKTGDTLDLGNGKQLIFVEMRMLHWPDSMATYLTQDNVLFSNDAFGQHYAVEGLFNDLADPCVLEYEALKYYANILNPFSPLVKAKIQEIIGLAIPIDLIATSHGVLWRTEPLQIIEKYARWADAYQENQVTVIYDTMWEGTRQLADRIAQGVTKQDPACAVKVLSIAKNDKNDIMSEVFRSKAIAVGSPTVGNSVLSSVHGLIHFMKELKFKQKKAAVFGCYGWSGEGNQVLSRELTQAGFEVIDSSVKINWNPKASELTQALELGRELAKLPCKENSHS